MLDITKEKFIGRKELARTLGQQTRGRPFSEKCLIAWEERGFGPPTTRIGREVLYRVSAVEAWLRAQEVAVP